MTIKLFKKFLTVEESIYTDRNKELLRLKNIN